MLTSSDTNQIIKWHDFLIISSNPPVTHKYKYVHTYLECVIVLFNKQQLPVKLHTCIYNLPQKSMATAFDVYQEIHSTVNC